jgi:hypothetical protein
VLARAKPRLGGLQADSRYFEGACWVANYGIDAAASSDEDDDDDDDGGIRDASHPSVLSSSASSVEARPAVKRARRQLADAMSLDDDDGDDDNDDDSPPQNA